MSKGKFKELLFDINENELIEYDEEEGGKKRSESVDSLYSTQEYEPISFDESLKRLGAESRKRKKKKSGGQNQNAAGTASEKPRKTKEQQNAKRAATKVSPKPSADSAKKTSEPFPIMPSGVDKVKEAARSALSSAASGGRRVWSSAAQGFGRLGERLGLLGRDISKTLRQGGAGGFFGRYLGLIVGFAAVLLIGIGIYIYNYQKLPTLNRTHIESAVSSYQTYNAEVHPMQLLSTVRENMEEYRGAPTGKGDGKSAETRYVVYSLDWFGMKRKTVLFYDTNGQFIRIKLEIGNESAQSLFDKLKAELGTPLEEDDPTVRGGYAIWIKDAVRYKFMHRGTYSTLEMSIAEYENPSALALGDKPVTIQYINQVDLNGDGTIDEKILLLGNKGEGITTHFAKLYLLVWDGKKTYLKEMASEYDGGTFPQLIFANADEDPAEELVVVAENNVVNHYNVFKYTGTSLDWIYAGYENIAEEQNE